jgi:hypothetical protein
MSDFQLMNLGAAPTGQGGDSFRAVGEKWNQNITILQRQFPIVSDPNVITGSTALTSDQCGKRISINLAAEGTIELPLAVDAGLDAVMLLRNIGTVDATIVAAKDSLDTTAVTMLPAGGSAVIDCDGVAAWRQFLTATIPEGSTVNSVHLGGVSTATTPDGTVTDAVVNVEYATARLADAKAYADARKTETTAYTDALRTDTEAAAAILRTDMTAYTDALRTDAAATYAPLDSAALLGIPTAPTAAAGTSTKQIASTEFVRTEVANLVNAAPATLDTLGEIAAQMANDESTAAALATTVGTKATLASANTWPLVQTFAKSPVVPTPANTTDAANKSYVDSGLNSLNSAVVQSLTAGLATKLSNPGGSGTQFILDNGGLSRAIASVPQSLPGPISGVPGFEYHIPGAHAAMTYLAGNGTWVVGTSGGSANVTANRLLLDEAGNMSISGGLSQASDIRIKTNVTVIEGAGEKVDGLRGVTWTRTDIADKERVYAGIIAQELQAVLPAGVSLSEGFTIPGSDEYILQVDPMAVVGILIEAVKELRARVATIEGNA